MQRAIFDSHRTVTAQCAARAEHSKEEAKQDQCEVYGASERAQRGGPREEVQRGRQGVDEKGAECSTEQADDL